MSDRDGRTSSSTSSPPQDAEFSAHQDDTTTSSSGLMTRTTHMSWSIVAIRSDPSRGRVVSLSPAAAAAAACVRSLLLSGCHWQPAATVQNGRLPSGGVSRFPTQTNRPFSGTQCAASAQPSPVVALLILNYSRSQPSCDDEETKGGGRRTERNNANNKRRLHPSCPCMHGFLIPSYTPTR
jgi:hypothetical protein